MSPVSQGRLANELAGIRALLLDVDDTIVDTRAAMVTAGSVALGALWPDLAAHHAAMAVRYYEDPERWFPRYASGEVRFDDMRVGRIEEVARAFGVATPEGALARYAKAYDPAFRGAQRLFEDVPDLLEVARGRRLPVALITNSAAAPTTLKLEALGLLDAFDAVVTTDTLGFGKPDPRMYLEACRRVDTPAPACVCVGDSLAWDVLGARDAGLRAVWLDRAGTGTDENVTRVTSLHQLTSALRAA
ncbi:HAD family hydrolase [Humibacillus sp. DSM 29435]|uniref:HAD family hydrolase n=1 Tax=Humibacillus sp. DSM 29435 TaxID=1869167 RepID=UPI0008721BEC|nr:HAD family hydrolase [Humibacillus sp. DSM 29435]OFE16713.1 HAD family hydrolase [Humibacillus sp. DSM 29435]